MAMELQLGLALPLPTNNPTKGFDLNTYVHDHKDAAVDCLDPVSHANGKKRAFHHSSAFRRTLPLLLWNDQPNDDGDDDPKDLDRSSAVSNDRDEEEEENGLVGWPPLKKRRKRIYMQKRGRGWVGANRRPLENNGGGFYRGSNSRYVKVKMEGVGIARKIDLSLHHSFAALRATLMNMFDETDSDSYRLTYQDMDGDWLLADDVTWRNFTGTVQRIQLEKNYG